MDIVSVKVNPANGDSSATLFNAADVDSGEVETVEKGTILRVVNRGNKFTEVQVNLSGDKEPKGGSSDEGICIANPYTNLYKDDKRKSVYGRVNNGSWLNILDMNDSGMYLVKTKTTNGTYIGYMEARYIFRKCLTVPSAETE